MSSLRRLVSSESVTEGHSDKLCDRVSDAVVDAVVAVDPMGRVACETLLSKGIVVVAGQITSTAEVSITDIVRKTIVDSGYLDASYGFDAHTCVVVEAISPQSTEIALGVSTGSSDQGMMVGYATTETPERMPLPIALAHRLSRRLAEVRKSGELAYLRPDGKTQATIEYENGHPIRVDAVTVSTQHARGVDLEGELIPAVKQHVIEPCLPDDVDLEGMRVFVNPTGEFVLGPDSDTGCTGRKIIVDTYGGVVPHGGGAFSGKDATKIDRCAAYGVRWIAKNVVAAGLADRCEVQVAYVIGRRDPVSVYVDTFGTEQVDPRTIERLVRELFDLDPHGFIRDLDLRRPVFLGTAAYGHFGRSEPEFTWEATDRADELRAAAS
jgi:S-adenosylmethionine synthetase